MLCDRYSGWIHAKNMGRTMTTVLIWERLMKLFVILGYPNIVRTDMGPK